MATRLEKYEHKIRESGGQKFYIYSVLDKGEKAFRNLRYIGAHYDFDQDAVGFLGGSKTKIFTKSKFREPTQEEKNIALEALFYVIFVKPAKKFRHSSEHYAIKQMLETWES